MNRPRRALSVWRGVALHSAIVALGATLFVGTSATAETDQTPMARVADRDYVRFEFDRDRVLTARQEIQIGSLEYDGNRTSFTARVKAFDGDDRLRQETEVRVDCNVRDPVMVMGFVDLMQAGAGGRMDVVLDAVDSLSLVPSSATDSLADLRLTLASRGGWRGLIGGRKVVTIRNRRVDNHFRMEHADSSRAVVQVREEITVKSYGLGIRLGSKTYLGFAAYDSRGGLRRYELAAPDGTSSVVERQTQSWSTDSNDSEVERNLSEREEARNP